MPSVCMEGIPCVIPDQGIGCIRSKQNNNITDGSYDNIVPSEIPLLFCDGVAITRIPSTV